VLIFDHALTPKLWIAASLLSAAKSSNTSIIIIPHGVNLFSEYPPDVFAKAFLNLKNLDVDYIIVPHKRYSHELLNNGVNSEKVIALGSARYCREWNGVLQRIVPSGNLPDTKKLKVVYMERGADRHGKYKDTIRETIEKISQLEFIHFIFKPQPRSNNLFLNIHCPIEIANDVNSVSLIRWADVVIATISSIILEILEQRKVFLYPRFFHEYRMLFDEMDACWAVNNYQELEGALRKLAREPGYKPYPDENADSFLNEVVYDSQGNSDVLGDYEKVILNSAKRAR
jgi:hypothetical protein